VPFYSTKAFRGFAAYALSWLSLGVYYRLCTLDRDESSIIPLCFLVLISLVYLLGLVSIVVAIKERRKFYLLLMGLSIGLTTAVILAIRADAL
jgi:hypothetical protein